MKDDAKQTITHGPGQMLQLTSICPTLIEDAGSSAKYAWEEFIYGKLRNSSTRKNYRHAINRFLSFCEQRQRKLASIMPRDVGEYLDAMPHSAATKKLHLAAVRHFFDAMVSRHAVILNPAASVRGPRLHIVEGKTPEIGVGPARRLLRSIDTSHVVGLRDKAILCVLVYTAVRANAVAKLRVSDFREVGDQHVLWFREKQGREREIPCRHDLFRSIRDYLKRTAPSDPQCPLFCTAFGRTKTLTSRAMAPGDIARMVHRRCRDIHLPSVISPHSFRVTTITDLLDQGIPLNEVQYLAGHADPRTTGIYDRRKRRVRRNIVERISV